MKWISAKDRLPERGIDFLAYHKDGFMTVTQYIFKGTFPDETLKYTGHAITHWMPLPEPPKESEEENV